MSSTRRPAPRKCSRPPEPRPPAAKTAGQGWSDLFALVSGGATASDEEAIMMCQARRVPVLALDGPVSRELIRHDRTGFILTPDKFENLRVHLSVMARFGDERRRVIEGARLWTNQSASPAAARDLLTSLIRSVMVSSGEFMMAEPLGGGLDAAKSAPCF
jgi:hypothetical protein